MFGMCLMGRHASLDSQLKVCGFKDEKQISPRQIRLFLLTSRDELLQYRQTGYGFWAVNILTLTDGSCANMDGGLGKRFIWSNLDIFCWTYI